MIGLPFLFNLPVSTAVREDVVGGEEELNAAFLGLGQGGEGHVPFVRFGQGLADFLAEGELEGVNHGAADENGVGLFEEAVNDLDFVGNLGAAEDDDKRAGGIFQFAAQKLQFAFHEQAGGAETAPAGDDAGDAFGGGMGAMGGAEGVVDVNIGDGGEFLGEGGVVGLFFVVVADVFQKEHVAGLEGGHRGGRLWGRCNRPQKRQGGRAFRPRRAATGWRDMEGSRLPLGRPRWAARMILAPRLMRRRRVGRVSLMRVLSLITILPSRSSIGTL